MPLAAKAMETTVSRRPVAPASLGCLSRPVPQTDSDAPVSC